MRNTAKDCAWQYCHKLAAGHPRRPLSTGLAAGHPRRPLSTGLAAGHSDRSLSTTVAAGRAGCSFSAPLAAGTHVARVPRLRCGHASPRHLPRARCRAAVRANGHAVHDWAQLERGGRGTTQQRQRCDAGSRARGRVLLCAEFVEPRVMCLHLVMQ